MEQRGDRLHRWLVRCAAGRRAIHLLAELDEEKRVAVVPTHGARRARAWYRAECRSLAYWYLTQRRRLAAPHFTSPRPFLPQEPAKMIDQLRHDLRQSFRVLRFEPGFSALIVGTLALGIGLNAAVLGVANAVLVRPLDLAEPDRVVRVWNTDEQEGERHLAATIFDYRDLRTAGDSFAAVTAWSTNRNGLGDALGHPTNVTVGRVVGDFMETLGIRPQSGRGFHPDEQTNGDGVAMLAHRYWLQRYGGSEDVLGSTVWLDEAPYEVVGIMPASWTYPPHVDVWRPFTPEEGAYADDDRELTVLARLGAGISVETASEQVTRIAAAAAERRPDDNEHIGAWVERLQAVLARPLRPQLLMLLGAVALVLAITCVNTAGLWQARAQRRQRELAIRTAVGATWARTGRQALVEALVLASFGGLAGVLAGKMLLDIMVAIGPAELPGGLVVTLDARVLLVCASLTALAGLVGGIPVALRAGSPALREGLASGARSSAPRNRAQRLLVFTEIALAVVLAVGAGLLLRSFDRLAAVDRGFDPERVLTVGLDIPDSLEDEDPVALYERVRERTAAVPGVQAVAYGRTHPLDPLGLNLRVLGPRGLPEPQGLGSPPVVRMVSDGYFATATMPVVAGRAFVASDDANGAGVAIVNETFARAYYGTEDAVGQEFELPWRERGGRTEIVGVVADVIAEVGADPRAALYVPFRQIAIHGVQLLVRSAAATADVTESVRDAIWQVEPGLTLDGPTPMQRLVNDQTASPRFHARLVAAFAAVALALAGLGIYGIVNLGVGRRTQELGVRQALGADRQRLRRMVLVETMRLVAPGLFAGLLAAYAVSNLLRSLLYGVAPGDPIATFAVAAVVLTTAMLAAWVPARRATRIDPTAALNGD